MGGIIKKQPRDRGESHRFPEPRTGSITVEGHSFIVTGPPEVTERVPDEHPD